MPYLIYNIHVSRPLVDRRNSYNRGRLVLEAEQLAEGGGNVNGIVLVASRASRRRLDATRGGIREEIDGC